MEGEPLNTWALTFLAYAELLTHKFGKVIVNARKVDTLPPEGFANPHAIAAKALEATGQPEQALAEYQLDLKETEWCRRGTRAASLAMVPNAIRERPGPSATGPLLIGAGVPIYWWFSRRKS